MWITKVRPGVDLATHLLNRIARAPTPSAMETLRGVLKDLNRTLDRSLTHRRHKGPLALTSHCDASLAEDITCSSHGGTVIYLGTNTLGHAAMIQPWVATATAESELMKVCRCCSEGRNITGVVGDPGPERPAYWLTRKPSWVSSKKKR